ncbi:MAG TPA: hypothetical protein VEH06_06895 [Candidatus Bathyarchaeia archaeon]|nr:hypothetical protein [Candidatus Bathyarchaeia archaeon]
MSGRLLSPTRGATVGAIITFTGTDKDGSTRTIVDRSGDPLAAITDIDGNYHTAAKLEMVECHSAFQWPRQPACSWRIGITA